MIISLYVVDREQIMFPLPLFYLFLHHTTIATSLGRLKVRDMGDQEERSGVSAPSAVAADSSLINLIRLISHL